MVGKTETSRAHILSQRIDHNVLQQQQSNSRIDHDGEDFNDSKPKKKRRVVKTGDKKYECPENGCGKSYSRAEHLYRHQLNHTPKQIYHCDFPGCDRNFVRADLCARHKERHTAKGSHLQRKDAFMHAQRTGSDNNISDETSPSGPTTVGASPGEPTATPYHHQQSITTTDPYLSQVSGGAVQPQPSVQEYAQSNNDLRQHQQLEQTMHLDPQLNNAAPGMPYANTNGHYQTQMMPPASTDRTRYDPYGQRSVPHYGMNQVASHPITNGNHTQAQATLTSPPQMSIYQQPQQSYPSPSSTNFRSPTAYSSLPSLNSYNTANPSYGATSYPRTGSGMSPPNFTTSDQHPSIPNSRSNSLSDFSGIDQLTSGFAMPVFGSDYIGINRSPPMTMSDDWIAQLLGGSTDSILDVSQPSPPAVNGPDSLNGMSFTNTPLPKLEPDGTPVLDNTPNNHEADNSEACPHGLDVTSRESGISEEKRQRLIQLISKRFNDSTELSGAPTRDEILEGYETDPDHVLGLKMLKTYLASFWVHIHQQMPILHRPTFNSETCPDLLLLAMMCLGASCLERIQPQIHTKQCANASFFMAYHIRWEIFKDQEFRPTAKLWTFQTMLLLELFEKMYSTKTLHERAHIHHATTLIVMRRGSSLIGRSAYEQPGIGNDPTRTPPGPDGTINTSGQNTPDPDWNRWITTEATRRVAFAAFIIDSTHATLFGHSAVMSPHDLKLPLPCDEALWAATSMTEVQRVEASLAANGFKPTSFLEGLKKTLNGSKVRTNTFGRQILMAGLLNVSWHMNQRDLQVSSLGVGNALGSQIKWRAALTRAFDFWRRDFDESLAKSERWLEMSAPAARGDKLNLEFRDTVFESRTCLHSLAHMAMHVELIDCTVFAGSERVLGRIVTDQDRAAVHKRMTEQWAPSARARDAVFYALRFLCEVLIPDEDHSTQRRHPSLPPVFSYSAKDDYLLNRPWVLYFAALIVWSYGYALDGPIRPSNYTLTTREMQILDMQRYLKRMGRVAAPDDLDKQKDRNSCLGLLMLLRVCFKEPRWELLHEAGDLLGSCIEMLLPGNVEVKTQK